MIVYRIGKRRFYPCLSILKENQYSTVIKVLNVRIDSCSASPYGGHVTAIKTLDVAYLGSPISGT